jgi:hypothetical protein
VKAGLIVAVLAAAFSIGYRINLQAHPAPIIKSPVSGGFSKNMDCKHLKAELNSLKRQKYELLTALTPELLHLARLESLTGLNSVKTIELESELAKVRREKGAVLRAMEAKGCHNRVPPKSLGVAKKAENRRQFRHPSEGSNPGYFRTR